MRRTLLFLMILMCVAAAGGFCGGGKEPDSEPIYQEQTTNNNTNEARPVELPGADNTRSVPLPLSPPPPEEKQRVPVFREIISIMRDHRIDLDALNYYLSSSVALVTNEQITEYKSVDGNLTGSTVNHSESIVINYNIPGKIKSPFSLGTGDPENIDIDFVANEKAVTLRFTKNRQSNLYELISFNRDGAAYDLDFEYRPFLTIDYSYTTDGEIIQAQGLSPPFPVPAVDRVQTANPARTPVLETAYYSPAGIRPPLRENILLQRGESSYLKLDVIVEYMQENRSGNNASWFGEGDVEALIETYIRIAGEENINHDIAIAQMWYATEKLGNGYLRSSNYAAFTKAGALMNGLPWDGVFHAGRYAGGTDRSQKDAGVLAHIMHLKAYASSGVLDHNKTSVDPRFHLLGTDRRGIGDTLSSLAPLWTEANPGAYADSIRKIMNELYDYQERYERRTQVR